ncbi:O-antigen ligase family protein [Terrimonas sp. NA20]|uniref:O-antigen ligase family protein n=1 Tax=Terrimonas ginsenosidimutans TaxID=2908004 RepID=A0ABS9KLF2_9BACT|nr:O-antigen ligase family protein [Terrimonas ginsenosidimutans]MCG2613142.1 O-antigen ligase family protein [Terrimonas ginsenosidimutans]
MTSLTANNRIFFFTATALFVLTLALSIITEYYYLLAIPFAVLLFQTGWVSFSAIFLLLIASIPFSTEVLITESLGTDLPDEMLMLLVSVLFFFHLINNTTAFFKIIWHPLVWLVLVSFCWSAISLAFSTHIVLSVKFLLAKSWYMCAFLAATFLVNSKKDELKRIATTLALSMFVCTMIIFIRHAALGFSFAGINDAVDPFFRNHVNYSALLVCTLPVWYGYWKLFPASQKLVAVVIAILLIALFLSYARGAWLALLVAIITGWLMMKKVVIRVLMITVMVTTIAVGWLAYDDQYLRFAPDQSETIFHEDFREHLVATYEMKDLSAAERFYRWIAGVRMIPDHWLTGFGPGTFYHNYKPYAVPAFETWVSENEEHSTVHNYFLLTAIEQGIPGLVLLLLLAGSILFYAQRLYHRIKDPFYRIASFITGLIFSMILTLNLLSDLIETDKIGSLFFLCIAVLVILDKKTAGKAENV